MDYDKDARRRRETFLSVVLTLLALSGFFFLFFIICGAFSIYIVAIVAVIGLVGLGHYFFWGHSLSEQVAGEREEEEAGTALEDEQATEDTDAYRDRC